MRNLAYIIFLLTLLASCDQKRTNNLVVKTKDIEEAYDSTYLFQLEDAYKKKDTILLGEFFKNWNALSETVTAPSKDSLTEALYGIFEEVYHPFDLEKYGWLPRPHYKKHTYAILPSEIRYKIVDTIHSPDISYNLKLDTLRPFYPKPNLGKAKALYDINPFKKAIGLFLESESFGKREFLYQILEMPISHGWKEYKTDPKILGILINRRLDKALVYIRLVSTGLGLKLIYVNEQWKVAETEELWIE